MKLTTQISKSAPTAFYPYLCLLLLLIINRCLSNTNSIRNVNVPRDSAQLGPMVKTQGFQAKKMLFPGLSLEKQHSAFVYKSLL